MKKAAIAGIFSGMIISVILVCATYIRRFLPDTFTANLLFYGCFFSSIAAVIWLSLHYCFSVSAVRWKNIGVAGILSSLIAALLTSLYGLVYDSAGGTGYMREVLRFSRKTYSEAEQLWNSWAGVADPLDTALYTFRDLIGGLCLITLLLGAIYYLRHRRRLPHDLSSKNHELIF